MDSPSKTDYEASTAEQYVSVEMPLWMLKQLRGTARHEMHNAITPYGQEDAEEIYRLLDYHYEEATR